LNGDQQLVDSLTDRHVTADKENAWYGQAGADSVIGERRNRVAIVCQLDQAPRREGRSKCSALVPASLMAQLQNTATVPAKPAEAYH
jgi:hypothetical protein